MKKFSVRRMKGARKAAQARWQGSEKILKLLARAEHSLEGRTEFCPVIYNHYAVDLLVNRYSL
jgi:hypothetical protein